MDLNIVKVQEKENWENVELFDTSSEPDVESNSG